MPYYVANNPRANRLHQMILPPQPLPSLRPPEVPFVDTCPTTQEAAILALAPNNPYPYPRFIPPSLLGLFLSPSCWNANALRIRRGIARPALNAGYGNAVRRSTGNAALPVPGGCALPRRRWTLPGARLTTRFPRRWNRRLALASLPWPWKPLPRKWNSLSTTF